MTTALMSPPSGPPLVHDPTPASTTGTHPALRTIPAPTTIVPISFRHRRAARRRALNAIPLRDIEAEALWAVFNSLSLRVFYVFTKSVGFPDSMRSDHHGNGCAESSIMSAPTSDLPQSLARIMQDSA